EPLGTAGRSATGSWLIDLSGSLPRGLLAPNQSTVGQTITVFNPGNPTVDFDASVSARPAPHAPPLLPSPPPPGVAGRAGLPPPRRGGRPGGGPAVLFVGAGAAGNDDRPPPRPGPVAAAPHQPGRGRRHPPGVRRPGRPRHAAIHGPGGRRQPTAGLRAA